MVCVVCDAAARKYVNHGEQNNQVRVVCCSFCYTSLDIFPSFPSFSPSLLVATITLRYTFPTQLLVNELQKLLKQQLLHSSPSHLLPLHHINITAFDERVAKADQAAAAVQGAVTLKQQQQYNRGRPISISS
jgi:hypothetical protein